MGAYTQSIREILQMHKTSAQSLMNVQDVHDIAEAYLFDEIPLNVISPQYIDAFITGFTLHFINEELGLETLPLWKIALNEKIYNNGSFINLIFQNLDKQIFADYKVHLVTSQDSHSNTKLGTGTLTNVRDEDVTTDVSDSITNSETITGSGRNEVTGTGTVQNAMSGSDTTTRTGTDTDTKSGSDTTTRTGTDTDRKSGTDTVSHTGTDETAKSGSDTLAQTGTDANAHTGTQGNVGSNTSQTLNTGTTSNDHNSQQINSDTPMGSLQNLRTPGGNAKGTGVGYANSQTYNYMSSAIELDESNVQTDNTQQDVSGSDSSTTTFNDTTTETRNLQDQTTYNSSTERTVNLEDETTYGGVNTKTLDLEDETTYGGVNTKTLNLEDETTYGKSNLETRNTSDVTVKSDSTQKSGTQGKTGQTVVDGSVTDTQTRNLSDTDNGTKSGSINESEYSLNWEMLFKTMPLLNRVWGIFDDLFMLIY